MRFLGVIFGFIIAILFGASAFLGYILSPDFLPLDPAGRIICMIMVVVFLVFAYQQGVDE